MANKILAIHKEERKKDTDKILDSEHQKKVVVAGPGTGKSFLFQEAIKREILKGKNKFLALTFVGKLCDELADDLAGLAETRTLHGFARESVLGNVPSGWEYYPEMSRIIGEDLAIAKISNFKIGDDNYKSRTKFYKAVGHDDVIHYAIKIFKEHSEKIPIYDLLLVDEYQDFNEEEAELVDLLSSKSKTLIVGDDDQALYEFKGSYSKFIRDKFHDPKNGFEKHTLKYCSRCTSVIVSSFNNIVKYFDLNKKIGSRVPKEYVCFTPDKERDNELNPRVILMNDIPGGMLAYKIKIELTRILQNQKIKTVLVIGEARTCKEILSQTARLLGEIGFSNVNFSEDDYIYNFDDLLLQGCRLLYKDEKSPLGWRLIIDNLGIKEKIISTNLNNVDGFIDDVPESTKKETIQNARVLKKIFEDNKYSRDHIAESSINKLAKYLVIKKKIDRDIFIDELRFNQGFLTRPLRNLDITICSILGAKGLGADVVFLIGFDNGRLPLSQEVKENEIYQFLVALTRAKKRIYLINSRGRSVSKFINSIGDDNYEVYK